MTDRVPGDGRSRRDPWRLLPLTVALVAIVTIGLVGGSARTGAEPTPVAPPGTASPIATPTPAHPPEVAAAPPSPDASATPDASAMPDGSHTPAPLVAPDTRPVALRVAAIDVDAPMVELGLNPDRTLEVPADTVNAGWYGLGPRPGEPGPAVIAGHVDSKAGPGVFFRLRELQPGASIEVAYDDGSLVTFTVTEVAQHGKSDFPTARVYGDTRDAQLRLITCGGSFDRAEGHYRDNVIVFATRSDRQAVGHAGGEDVPPRGS